MPQKLTFTSMARASREELERLFAKGTMPDLEMLVGWEFRGHNPPAWAKIAGITKFKKGFFRKGRGPWPYEGYNLPVEPTPISEPWECKPSNDNPKRFGFYAVLPASEAQNSRDRRFPNSIFLNYAAAPENPRLDPSRVIKDYVVQVDPDNPDLFLGKAFLTLGPARVFSNFFLLERDCKSNFTGS